MFDKNYVYIDTDKVKYDKSDILEIKYGLLNASYIDFKNKDRYYFLIDQTEFLTRRLKKELLQ